MASTIDELLDAMRNNPVGVRFGDACRVADHFFGEPTQNKSSHRVWRMPWSGNPRVNMQNEKGYAKAYQVRQLLEAVERRIAQLNVVGGAIGATTEPPKSRETQETKKRRKRKNK